MEIRGHCTDGKSIQVLAQGGPPAERLAAVLYLMSVDGQGIRPDKWPTQVVAKLAGDKGAYRAGGRIFLHIYARETAPPAEVAQALEQVLALAGELRADLRRPYFAEAAYWQAATNRNPALARAWLDDARAVKGAVGQKDWDAAALTAIAIAEGNPTQAREHLTRAFAFLDRQPGPSGTIAAERSRLQSLWGML